MNALITCSLITSFRRGVRKLRRHPISLSLLTLICSLALIRLLIDPTPRIPLVFNLTPSLPYHVALLSPPQLVLKRGDLVVYAFEGEAALVYPGLRGQPLFKRVVGLPGDRVSVRNSDPGPEILVNGEVVGLAKPFTRHGVVLNAIPPGVIPAGHYYVQGLHPDSFDSRYRQSGLVRAGQVLAMAHPLL
jgi:conjugal transfer pilin signal peptidase TrbI